MNVLNVKITIQIKKENVQNKKSHVYYHLNISECPSIKEECIKPREEIIKCPN